MTTAYYLGIFQTIFQSGSFDKNLIANLDETHFIINMNKGCTLDSKGDTCVKYANVAIGEDAMTMIAHISRGCRFSIKIPMPIFANKNSNYSIHSIDNSIPRVL